MQRKAVYYAQILCYHSTESGEVQSPPQKNRAALPQKLNRRLLWKGEPE